MKKKVWIGVIIAASLIVGCGRFSGRYADVRDYMEQSIKAQEEYLSAIEKADSAQEIAGALNKFAERFLTLKPKMKVLMEKYPEIASEKELPSELRGVMNRQNDLAEKIHNASMKNVSPHTTDPAVVEATKNLAEAMGDN